MNSNIFHCTNIDDLKKKVAIIRSRVEIHGFAIIRGLFNRELIQSKLPCIYEYANTHIHQPSAGVSSAQIRTNMSKWSIGGYSNSQSGIARFMLTIYNPLFQPDIFRLHDTFKQLLAIRDTLAERAVQTDQMLTPERFNACRLQIYPSGGGFMGEHIDSRAASNLIQAEAVYIQLVLLLTEKGKDFNSGGAFIIKNGQEIDSEADGQCGDILVYDGATLHGVRDIDPEITFNMHNLRGRTVALATIYNYA